MFISCFSMDCGEVLDGKTSVSDNKHVKLSPQVKVMNTDDGGGCGLSSENTSKEIEHVSARSSDSSETLSSSSLKASSCEDTVQVNSQILPNSVGENEIPQPSGGSNRLEECVEECRESISQLSDVDHACLVEGVSPILSPSILVVECPEDYDPNSPAFVIDSDSQTMEGNASPDNLLFSIHASDDAISSGAESNKSGELPKSRQSFRSRELCQSEEPSKSGEPCTSGEIHETKECQSIEHLKANDSKKSDELGRFSQISPTCNRVEPEKKLDMEKTMSVDVKRGEKGSVGEPINGVPEGLTNNQVDTSVGDSKDTRSKHESDGTVALPKKKKSSCKSCRCFKWPSCSSKLSGCSCKRSRLPRCFFKWFICRGCFFCERPSSRLKYPRWAGRCFKCLYWPCLVCRC